MIRTRGSEHLPKLYILGVVPTQSIYLPSRKFLKFCCWWGEDGVSKSVSFSSARHGNFKIAVCGRRVPVVGAQHLVKMLWYQNDDDEEEDLMYSPALMARRASESWIDTPPVEVVVPIISMKYNNRTANGVNTR